MTATYLCPDCGERVDDGERHPACCPHDNVEPDDDGLAWRGFVCRDCSSVVVPTEDGWEVME